MRQSRKDLIDLRKFNGLDDIVEYIREHSARITRRLWIASPFISSEKMFYYLFQISKIKKHKPEFKLLTDLSHVSINNYNILKFFIENGELRTLENLHSKIYIMENYPVITSANMTFRGFYVNYESAIAGDNGDINRYEQMYNELWSCGAVVSLDMLDDAVKNSDYVDNDDYSVNLKCIRNVPKELTGTCSYETFLLEFKNLSDKYVKYGRIWPNTPLKFEMDSFLNYLFHHSPNHSSQDFYYWNETNPLASDNLLAECIYEYHEWIKSDSCWDNENVRENYRKNALKLFSKDNINMVTLEEVSEFLKSNINTYLTNSVRFNWAKKFIKQNDISKVISFISKIIDSSPKDIDNLVKRSPIAYMGESTLQELLGLIRDDLPIRNENTNAGMRYLGYPV